MPSNRSVTPNSGAASGTTYKPFAGVKRLEGPDLGLRACPKA